MSSLVLMKLLESAPGRYDAGMSLLTLGQLSGAQQAVADIVVPAKGASVLEIGCGTGLLTEKLLAAGASVEAIDQNPQMLDQARRRLSDCGSRVRLRECAAAEIDSLPEATYDGVAASLSLSEMSVDERAYVLTQVARILKPAGCVAIVDEIRPGKAWQRLIHAAVRWPVALVTWMLTGSTTYALDDLPAQLAGVGLEPYYERCSWLGTLAVVAARKPL